jgi:hypothetical protein
MTKTIDTTAAKIGRSMKKCEMRISVHSRVNSAKIASSMAAAAMAAISIRRAPWIDGLILSH